MKIFLNFFVFMLSNCEIVLNDLQQKFQNLQRDLAQDDSNQGEIMCHQKFLNTFGFAGYQFAQKRKSFLCPYLEETCCTAQDEHVSEMKWAESGEIVLGKRYSFYIKSLQYLLGFQQEAQYLMNDLLDSKELQCRQAAVRYKNLRISNPLLTNILKVLKNSFDKVTEIRRGTYCSVCDAKTSQELQKLWNQSEVDRTDSIFFSQHFCRSLVAETIQSAYFTTRYVKNFLESFSDMISCKANNSTTIEFDLPQEEVKYTRNCMFFRDKSFFFFCERYCENFSLTKFTPLFDGYVEQLRIFVKHVARYRNELFYYPEKNAFINNVQKIEEFLHNQSGRVRGQQVFVSSKIFNLQIDQLQTDFLYKGGVDITHSYKNSGYKVQYMSATLMNLLSILAVFILIQFLY